MMSNEDGKTQPQEKTEDPTTGFENLDKFSAEVDRYEKANADARKILAETKAFRARELIGGRSEAGREPAPEISPEKKKVNDAVDYFKGTQLEKDIRRANE